MKISRTKLLSLVVFLSLIGCTKTAPSNTESTQEQTAEVQGSVTDVQVHASDDQENSPQMVEEITKPTKQLDVESNDTNDSGDIGQLMTDDDNPFLDFIPEDVYWTIASTRKVPSGALNKYIEKKQRDRLKSHLSEEELNNSEIKLSPEDEEAINKMAKEAGLIPDAGLPEEDVDYIAYMDGNALVIVMRLEDSQKFMDFIQGDMGMYKIYLSMFGYEIKDFSKAKKSIVHFSLNKRDNPFLHNNSESSSLNTLYGSVKVDTDKAIIVVTNDNKVKSDKYFSKQKKSLARERLGLIHSNTTASLLINNEKSLQIAKEIMSMPMISMITMMLKISFNDQCMQEYRTILAELPETRVDMQFDNNTLTAVTYLSIKNKEILSKLNNIKGRNQIFSNKNNLAYLNVQMNPKLLYDIISDISKSITETPFKCQSLVALNNVSQTIPDLFSSKESQNLLSSLNALSFAVTELSVNEGKSQMSYAANVQAKDPDKIVPLFFSLLSSKPHDVTLIKDKPQKMPFPLDEFEFMPEGNALITDNAYYIASLDYDVEQLPQIAYTDKLPIAEASLTQTAYAVIKKSMIEMLNKKMEETNKKNREEMRKSLKSLQKRMQEIGAEADSDEEIERRLESFDNLKRFDNTLERTNSYLGADRISVSVDLSDENLVIKAQFVN